MSFTIQKAAAQDSTIIATVNDFHISAEHYEESYVNHIINSGVNDSREERYGHLQKLINDILLAQKAEDFELLDKDFELYVDRARSKALADYYYYVSFMDTLSPPSEAQIRTAYINSKINLFVSQLYFESEKLAEEYYLRLKKGASFVDLANELYNTDAYDSTAGYIGEISYFGVDHKYAEAAYHLKKDEYSTPVKTSLGYYIIKVEGKKSSPIYSESEYLTKKKGMEEMTKSRLLTLKGDEFVADYMAKKDVVISTENIRKVFELLKSVSETTFRRVNGRSVSTEKISASIEDIELLKNQLSLNMPLASYRTGEEVNYFTLEDYLFWLPVLPISEAKNKTIASVGRGLRNHIFYDAAIEKGLKSSSYVEFKVTEATQQYKAWQVKNFLSNLPVDSIDNETIQLNFKQLGYSSRSKIFASGWFKEMKDFDSASVLKKRIDNNLLPISSLQREIFDQKLTSELGHLGKYLNTAPLNSINIIGTGEGYFLAYVEDRTVIKITLEEVRDEIEKKIKPFYNIVQQIKTERANADIEIHQDAFESLMSYYDDPVLRGQ